MFVCGVRPHDAGSSIRAHFSSNRRRCHEATRHLVDLLLGAARWGGSFLFMRVAASEFGTLALIELRVAIAAVFLLVVLAPRGRLGLLRAYAASMAVVGVINSALPVSLLT
jgi:drug/metabolite transporter (DMT)-like permease